MSLPPELLPRLQEFILEKSHQIINKLKPRTVEELRAAMPFHGLFFGDEGLVGAANQRSIVTSMGQSLYPGIAKLIIEHTYNDVFVSGRKKKGRKAIEGQLPPSVLAVIGQVLESLYQKKRQPNHEQEIAEILATFESAAQRQDQPEDARVEPDVHIGDYETGPLFIELKSPYANKDVCYKSKNKLLTYLAIMHSKGIRNAQAYLGLTYNPDVEREAFDWWPVKQIMDMQKQILIGEELWDKLGGPGAYRQLLDIIAQVRKQVAPQLK